MDRLQGHREPEPVAVEHDDFVAPKVVSLGSIASITRGITAGADPDSVGSVPA